MLIALVSDEFPPANKTGGIGTYTKALAEMLANSEEHDVHVFCQFDAIEKRREGAEQIHAVAACSPKWPPSRIAYHRLIAPLFGSIEHRIRWGISVGRAVMKTEEKLGRKFDVIEVPEAGGFGPLIRLAGVKTPMLVRLHTSTAILLKHSSRRPTLQDRLISILERQSIKKGDLITSPSWALLKESRDDLGLVEEECWVYPNLRPPALNSSQIVPRSRTGQDTVLVAGRLCNYKGTDLVLQAVGRLQTQGYPELRLVMIGRSEWPRKQFDEMIMRNLRPGTCELVGEIAQSEVLAAMRGATMLVQASRYDNYPNTVLEAFLSGCLVVGSNAGGIPEIVTHRHTGLLFESGDAESLQAQIQWALDHPEESDRMARSGTGWVHSELSAGKLLNLVTAAYKKTREIAERRRRITS